jgi:hypothetical protein
VAEIGVSREETGQEVWLRQPNEPKKWFLRFERYYLYAGLSRTIRKAYAAAMQEQYPKTYSDILAAGRGFQSWLAAAKEYRWKDRADAWDEAQNEEMRLEVLRASRFLMSKAMDAAEALIDALSNPRLQVSAANAILNRIGMPEVTKQELLDVQVPVSADELARVKDAVKKWEESTFKLNG